MKSAGYVVLFTIAGCSQGVCRCPESVPGVAPGTGTGTGPAAVAPEAGAAGTAQPGAEAGTGEQEALDEQIKPLRRGGRRLVAEPPDDAEEAAYGAWVTAAARAAQGRQPPPAAPAGFALRVVPGRDLWVLSEDGSRRRGAAAVVLRAGAAAPLIVEAPHTFFDRGTLPIALALFEAQRARALIVNTSHRYGGGPRPGDAGPDDEGAESGSGSADEEGAGGGAQGAGGAAQGGAGATQGAGGGRRGAAGGGERDSGRGGARDDDLAARARTAAALAFADVAHAERSFFLSAHRALLQSFPGAPAVQLHGFQDSSAPDAAAVVSAVGPGADLDRLLGPLRAAVGDGKVLPYPAEIKKLGGSTNVQARWSRQVGAPFYHVELSRTLRDKLVEDAELRRRFAGAFAGIAAGKEAGPAEGDRAAPGAAR
ncbi:hypothetical protein [Sorangium sp. So ce131]|uniref:hypothetical protein n=1 Tax=Sorangium sp. So ce131 TaxID=3133282 RepID=UPI003F626760